MEYRTLDRYPNYLFYEDGTIMNIRWKEPRKCGATPNNNGYLVINLKNKYGEWEYKGIQRLICSAFHGLPKLEGLHVNHKDSNKHNNNHFDNLEWMTPIENAKHGHNARWERLVAKYS